MNGKQDQLARTMIASLIGGQKVMFVAPTEADCYDMVGYIEGALTPEERARLTTFPTRKCPPGMNYLVDPDAV